MRKHDWFTGLPSWIQPDKSWYERSDRTRSLASTTVAASVGASTKRRSRADAMRCLEGKEQASISATSDSSPSRHHESKDEPNCYSEDEDPWTDPWKNDSASAHSDGRCNNVAASSIYSDKSHWQHLKPHERSAGLESQEAGRKALVDYEACHRLDNLAVPLQKQTHNTSCIGAKVKAALRLSSHGSDDTSALLEPELPPAIHLPDDRRTDTSQSRPPSNFWPQTARHEHRNGPENPYAALTEQYVPLKNAKLAPAREGDFLGWHQPYWTPKLPTPKDTYHQVERRPSLDRSMVLYDVELDQHTAVPSSRHHISVNFHTINPTQTQCWLQAMVGAMMAFHCFGLHHAFGIFQQYYVMQYPYSSLANISMIGSTQLALMLALFMPLAKLSPKHRLKLFCLVGFTIMVLSIFSTSWCTSIVTLWLVQGLLTGIGMALTLSSGITAMMSWFDDRGAALMVLTLATAAGYLGGIVYTIVIDHLVTHQGFATTMRVLAAVVIAGMTPAILLMRAQEQRYTIKRESFRALAGKPHLLSYPLTAFGLFLAFLGLHFTPTYITTISASLSEPSDTQGRDILLVMLTGGICGCGLITLSLLRDIRITTASALSSMLSGIVLLSWLGIPWTYLNLATMSTSYGFASSGIQMLCLAGPYIFDKENHDMFGMVASLGISWRDELWKMRAEFYMICMSIAALVGPAIAGAIANKTEYGHPEHAYRDAQIFAGVVLLAGCTHLLASRFMTVGFGRVASRI